MTNDKERLASLSAKLAECIAITNKLEDFKVLERKSMLISYLAAANIVVEQERNIPEKVHA